MELCRWADQCGTAMKIVVIAYRRWKQLPYRRICAKRFAA